MELRGPLDLLGLSHLLRVGEIHRCSFALAVDHIIGRGEIVMGDGLVTWARLGRTRGLEALRTFLSWSGASFRIDPPAVPGGRGGGLSPRVLLDGGLDDAVSDPDPVPADSPIRGRLALVTLRQLLHIFRGNGRSVTIRLVSPGPAGDLEIESGAIVKARCGAQSGKRAVKALLAAEGLEAEVRTRAPGDGSEDPLSIDLFLERTREEEHDTAVITKNEKALDAAPLVEQLRVAKKGNFKEKLLAACSRNDKVALAVVEDRNIGAELAEALAGKAMTNPQVLHFLGTAPPFRKQYAVARALVFNPATPLNTAVNLLDSLREGDIRKVVSDPSAYPEALRARAKRALDLRRQRRAVQ